MTMGLYWIINGPRVYPKAKDKRPCAEYTPFNTEPTGSSEVAYELEGMDVETALVYLEDFYETVWFNGSEYYPRILCHGPEGYNPDADYEEELEDEDGIEFEEEI